MRYLKSLLVTIVLLGTVLAAGCASGQKVLTPVPPYHGGQEAEMVELTLADFTANPHITREIELVRPGSLIVSLETNEAPGQAWNEQAEVSSPVVAQVSHALATPAPPDDDAPAPATLRDVWVFDSLEAGAGLVRFVYGDPGAESGVRWTLTLYLTVQ
jgi:hypothetical protein